MNPIRTPNLLILVTGLFLMTTFVSCAQPAYYAIEVENKTAKEIDNVRLVYDDGSFEHSIGSLPDEGVASYMDARAPLPNSATLTWTSLDGQQHKAKLQLPSLAKYKHEKRNRLGRIDIAIMEGDKVQVSSGPY